MDTAKLSTKGQVTIPVGIRRKLGLRTGENVVFIEQFESVVITSERGVTASGSTITSNESNIGYSKFYEEGGPFIEPKGFISKNERRKTIQSLIGSIDDPTFIEPPDVEYNSPRDWGLMDQ